MLVILGLIIAKAADPATWAWLASDEQGGAKARVAAAPADAKPPVKSVANEAKPELVTAGPTDQDIEERDAASEEYMALTDGGLEQRVEEMPAYWRQFGWVQHQSTDQLRQRASRKVVFNQFIRNPEEQRGKLFQFDLNVRQVLQYPATTNKVGVKTVYEIRGFTTESKAWLFFLLTPELPEGFPTGTDVVETVTFARVWPQGVHRMPALSSIAMSEGRRRFRSRSAVMCWVKSGDRSAAAAARRAALRYRTAAW